MPGEKEVKVGDGFVVMPRKTKKGLCNKRNIYSPKAIEARRQRMLKRRERRRRWERRPAASTNGW